VVLHQASLSEENQEQNVFQTQTGEGATTIFFVDASLVPTTHKNNSSCNSCHF